MPERDWISICIFQRRSKETTVSFAALKEEEEEAIPRDDQRSHRGFIKRNEFRFCNGNGDAENSVKDTLQIENIGVHSKKNL